MTGHSIEHALNGLAAELEVQVSPEFAAKVRAAVDAQPQTSRVWFWGLVGVAAAASVTLGVVMTRPAAVPDAPYVGRTFHLRQGYGGLAEASAEAVRSAEIARPKGPAYAPPVAVRRPVVRTTQVAPTEQALALNRFLLGIRSGRAPGSGGTRAPIDQDGLLLTPDPIEIPLIRLAPIQIEPLPVPDPDDSSEEQQ